LTLGAGGTIPGRRIIMSLRDDLAAILARDARYSVHAYAFVFEALEHTKTRKRQAGGQPRSRRKGKSDPAQHVTGQELCHGAKELALRLYGLMAVTVLARWGITSTSDLGNIVYNLIAAGDMERSAHDSRSDFDGVYDFEAAFRRDYVVVLDEVA
jgi:uncharacterized repeat protein (TIGR04138 family)